LVALIQAGETSSALGIIGEARGYRECEEFVFDVLGEEKSTPELVEAALKAFLGTRENYKPQHGYWVHSLSHFTKHLWKRRLISWIKRFNEVAFKGANELRDANCSDRLVGDFAHFADWSDDPSDFHLTMENLGWMRWEYSAYAKARIEAGVFTSEEAYVRWQLHQPQMWHTFNYEAQMDLVDVDKIQGFLQRLLELGADTSEFDGLIRRLLEAKLAELEAARAEQTPETPDWTKERVAKGIEITRGTLVSL
jgi:hypothetical protein